MLRARENFVDSDIQRLFEGKRHFPTDRPLLADLDDYSEEIQQRITELTKDDVDQRPDPVQSLNWAGRQLPGMKKVYVLPQRDASARSRWEFRNMWTYMETA